LSPPSPEPTIAAPFAFFVVIPEGNLRLPPTNFPKREIPKIKPKKLTIFSSSKTTTQNTTKTTESTTNSPRFHHRKTPENRKTPSKNRPADLEKKSQNTTAALTFSPSKPIRKAGDTACCLGSGIT
jgi:hypothetical protein